MEAASPCRCEDARRALHDLTNEEKVKKGERRVKNETERSYLMGLDKETLVDSNLKLNATVGRALGLAHEVLIDLEGGGRLSRREAQILGDVKAFIKSVPSRKEV